MIDQDASETRRLYHLAQIQYAASLLLLASASLQVTSSLEPLMGSILGYRRPIYLHLQMHMHTGMHMLATEIVDNL